MEALNPLMRGGIAEISASHDRVYRGDVLFGLPLNIKFFSLTGFCYTTHMNIRPRDEDAAIESAISFMVEKINESNTNPKPLILHSLRVGLRLYEKDESKKIVIAGLLHDLLEDTKCTEEEIAEQFGNNLLDFLQVFNFDDPVVHYKERWTGAIARMKEIGRDAAIVKIVDILDNLHFLPIVYPDVEKTRGLFWRHNLVKTEFAEVLKDDEDYQTYTRDLEALEAEFEKKIASGQKP